jgi:hypothetical protein
LRRLFTTRLLWLLWIGAVILFVAIWLHPVSDGRTRTAGLVVVPIIWLGLIGLLWSRPFLRYALLGFTAVCGVFIALPGRANRDVPALRKEAIAGLRRYTGTRYVWGGESPKGIDCSGLMRRGLIDGAFLRGITSADPGLVRFSIWLWWHDCSAADLGSGFGATKRCFTIANINGLNHPRILPGDMAVTTTGVHVMAYLGGDSWIEADPTAGRVIIEKAPATDNEWFAVPMNIVRWRILE